MVEYLVTEVACGTCPIAQLPNQQLRSDLSQGQGGPLGCPAASVKQHPLHPRPGAWRQL